MDDSDGWMTTKKTGRDDKAIDAAKKQAAKDRRAKRGLPPAAAATKNRKKKQQQEESESSGQEESDYSVGEEDQVDEEEEADFEEEEEEDEMISLHDDDTEDSDDDSDNGGSSFLPQSKRKNVKVKPMLAQAKKLKAQNKKKGFAATMAAAAPTLKLKPVSRSATSSDDDEADDYLSDSLAESKRPAVAKKERIDVSSDSEGSPPRPVNKSKYFHTKQPAASSKDPWESSEDDTPVKPKAAFKSKAGGRKRAIAVDEDDEDFTPAKAAASSSNFEDDDLVDDDEAIAIAEAMKESMNDGQPKKKAARRLKKLKGKNDNKIQSKRKKVHKDDSPMSDQDGFLQDSDEEEVVQVAEDAEPEVVDLLDDDDDDESSSGDENPQGDDEEDAYMDDEAREASSVLATANDLSASVLRIMTSWAGGSGDTDGDGKLVIPQGMIVDGAISLTNLGNNSSKSSSRSNANNHNQSWISEEVMQQILPKDIALKEYQLLGVNWLAMLHSMTCKVATDKKPRNVNGVLADEMGLGKTCQTIAFLAWLKYSRQKGDLAEAGNSELPKKDESDHEECDDDESDGDEVEIIDVDSKPSPKNDNKYAANVSVRKNDEESSPSTRLPHLIVVPASVVANWIREFELFAPDLHVVKYHGSMEERGELQRNLRPYMRKHRDPSMPMVDVVLTSITYFQKESPDDRDFLRKFQFDYMVVDEGHLLKNAKGLRYKNLDRFKTRHRLLLTGTPVQNTPKELMALLCFLMPLFSQKTSSFEDEADKDGGESMLQHFVQLEENAANTREDSHEFAYKKLKQLFAPFVLRRRKRDVLSQILKEKKYQNEFVDLGETGRRQYNSVIEAHVKAKRNKTKSATDHLFTQLRKAAHHPLLLRTRHTSPEEIDHLSQWFFQCGAFRGEASSKERVARELEKYNDFEIHLLAHELLTDNPRRVDLQRYILTEEDLFQSAKFVRLREILPKLINEGHRILIFSVWTSCLDLLGVMLDNMGLGFMRMDGQTPVGDRQGLIDLFNKDATIPIFLLSTTACGMGINLTAADVCIMHDINMNPFSDLQAEDRCHRIGQKKPVTIIKMISKDTVDSDIYDMQERKVRMNAAIMDAPSSDFSKKEKSQVMKNVIDRFLSSPKPAEEKASKPVAAAAAAEKENVKNSKTESDECKI